MKIHGILVNLQQIARRLAVPAAFMMIAAPAVGADDSGEADVAKLERSITGSAEAALMSGYLWHGLLLNDEPVFQPALTVEFMRFGLNLRANYDFTDAYSADGPAFTEVAGTAYCAFDIPQFAFTLGYTETTYPNEREPRVPDGSGPRSRDDNRHLAYGYVEMPDLHIVPSLAVEYGLGSDETLYAAFFLTYETKIAEALTAEVSGKLGWGNGDYHDFEIGVDQSGLSDATIGAALIWAPAERWELRAGVTYSYFIRETIADAVEAGGYESPVAVAGGLTAIYSF